MKSSNKARLRRAAARNRDRAVPPTPQTAARLKGDNIRRLYVNGRLKDHHAQAAKQIRTVFEAVGRGMFPALRPDLWSGQPPKRRPGRDFLDRMDEYERHLWQRYYLPWSHDLVQERAAGLSGARRLQLVIDVVVENLNLSEVEWTYGLERGRAYNLLVSALEKYAHRARLIWRPA